MQPKLLATMITTTTYGSWLPGDPKRLEQSAQRMAGKAPVLFTAVQQTKLFAALVAACGEFNYELTDASIESLHLHWMCNHGYDSVPVGRLKNHLRQALDIGRIWTEGYFESMCFEHAAVDARRGYIARHAGCRMSDGMIVPRRCGDVETTDRMDSLH